MFPTFSIVCLLLLMGLTHPGQAQTLPDEPTTAIPASEEASATPAMPPAPAAPPALSIPLPPAPAPQPALPVEPPKAPIAEKFATSPITYAKDQITLLPAHPLQESAQNGVLFQVEVRGAGMALDPDWFQLAGFAPNHGLLLTYREPAYVTIDPANVFAPYDVIAVNHYGEIVLLLPNIVLANVTEPIPTPQPVSALIYVAGGSASAIGLQAGDHVQHGLFQKRTAVMDSADDTPATTSPAATEGVTIENTTVPTSSSAAPPVASKRRKPSANPSIAAPIAPLAPKAPEVPKPAPAAPPANAAPAVDNSNLKQSVEPIPPVESAETKQQKSLLDMVLRRHHQKLNTLYKIA